MLTFDRALIRAVDLGQSGFIVRRRRESPGQFQERWSTQRRALRHQEFEATAICRAVRDFFLPADRPAKWDSYRLRSFFREASDAHVCHGVFIAGMVMSGYYFERIEGSANCRFWVKDVKQRFWRHSDPDYRPRSAAKAVLTEPVLVDFRPKIIPDSLRGISIERPAGVLSTILHAGNR